MIVGIEELDGLSALKIEGGRDGRRGMGLRLREK